MKVTASDEEDEDMLKTQSGQSDAKDEHNYVNTALLDSLQGVGDHENAQSHITEQRIRTGE